MGLFCPNSTQWTARYSYRPLLDQVHILLKEYEQYFKGFFELWRRVIKTFDQINLARMKMSVLWCIWIASISGIHKHFFSIKKIPTQRSDHGVFTSLPKYFKKTTVHIRNLKQEAIQFKIVYPVPLVLNTYCLSKVLHLLAFCCCGVNKSSDNIKVSTVINTNLI